MRRTLVLAAILAAFTLTLAAQPTTVLLIRVSLTDAGGTVTPIARHRLLISDNPATAPPREVVTAADGTATVKLSPGNYTVESDQPVAFQGKAYQWTQTLDILEGREASLDLTMANAELVTDAEAVAAAELDGSSLLTRWHDSVVAIWTESTRASGFFVDGRGLVATSQRAVGAARTVEVQMTPEIKVSGLVLAAEPGRDVAIVRVDAAAIGSRTAVPIACETPAALPLQEHDRVVALAAPLRGPKASDMGRLGKVGPHALETDFDLALGGAGGPAFAGDGRLVGLTSIVDGSGDRHPDFRVVRTGDICAVLASASRAMQGNPSPSGQRLPVEPTRPFPKDALEAAAGQSDRKLTRASSSGFDVAFITPPLAYAARNHTRPTSLPERPGFGRGPDPFEAMRQRALMDFGAWSPYFAEDPPVLIVRVTPKAVESFWKTIARGAAQTQGVSLPPLKTFKDGFASMQAFCGAAEVAPIHRFTLETDISDRVTITEGLYVFRPEALGPDCGSARLVIQSKKSAGRSETVTVDRPVLKRVWDDFAPYREQAKAEADAR